MRLPNADRAVVAQGKLREYLLSPTHTKGRFKAAFFASLGYTGRDSQKLAADIRSQHLILDAEEVEASAHGRMFVIRGTLTGPAKSANVVSVWIIDHGGTIPRFVTAYPAARR